MVFTECFTQVTPTKLQILSSIFTRTQEERYSDKVPETRSHCKLLTSKHELLNVQYEHLIIIKLVWTFNNLFGISSLQCSKNYQGITHCIFSGLLSELSFETNTRYLGFLDNCVGTGKLFGAYLLAPLAM